MKTITCKQMGGPCDAPMMANTQDEMMKVGMEHVEAMHPEMAAKIDNMPKEGTEMMEWAVMFQKTWDETPDM